MKMVMPENSASSNNDLLSRVFHISPAMILIANVVNDRIERIIDVNDSFLHSTGYTRDDVIDKELTELKIFPQLILDTTILETIHKDGYARDIEMSYCTKIDEVRFATAGLEAFEVDARPGILIVAIDITERKQAMEENKQHRIHLEETVSKRTQELQQAVSDLEDEIGVRRRIESELIEETERAEFANQAKSDFLANMSHELRTPLNSIIGFSELMLTEPESILTDEHKEKLKYVLESGWHLMSLINDILDLSKIEAGKMALNLIPVDVDILVANALTMFSEKAAQREITLSSQIYANDLSVNVDERKLKQILYNLIGNAIKFTNEHGRVTLMVEPCKEKDLSRMRHHKEIPSSDDYIKFSVSDNGIGIAKNELEKIFHPFHQIDTSFTRQYAGTGLGLTLSRQMVELHGGFLWAESKPGKGSKFSFLMPKQTDTSD